MCDGGGLVLLPQRRVPGSDLSTNLLIVVPHVIVYQRLEKDFAGNRIFRQLPLVPPAWRPFGPKVILRGESSEPDPFGNLLGGVSSPVYEGSQGAAPRHLGRHRARLVSRKPRCACAQAAHRGRCCGAFEGQA